MRNKGYTLATLTAQLTCLSLLLLSTSATPAPTPGHSEPHDTNYTICLRYPIFVGVLKDEERWRKEGSAMLTFYNSDGLNPAKESNRFCACQDVPQNQGEFRTTVSIEKNSLETAHLYFRATLAVGTQAFRKTTMIGLRRCLGKVPPSFCADGSSWNFVAFPERNSGATNSRASVLRPTETTEILVAEDSGDVFSSARNLDQWLAEIGTIELGNPGIVSVHVREAQTRTFSWRLFIEISPMGPPGTPTVTCPIDAVLGPATVSFDFAAEGNGLGSREQGGDLVAKTNGQAACQDLGCPREGADCGLSNCGRDCGPGCRDGKFCDEAAGVCKKLEHPGSCSNAWILMQLGVDDNGTAYKPDEADFTRTIGGTVDQSKTYALPSRKSHARFVKGRLDSKAGRAQFPPTCADRNGWTSFYVFETKELVGVSVDVVGVADDFPEGATRRWGSLDTVLEIKSFGGYCPPIRDIPNLGKPETDVNCEEAIEGGGERSWFLPIGGYDDERGVFRHCHFQSPCNDDGGHFGTFEKPARKPAGERGFGPGSRVEAWLVPGVYTLVVGGWSYDAKGSYEIFFKSVPGCLPRCGVKECGKESTCGTSCGQCRPGESCDSGKCTSFPTGEVPPDPRFPSKAACNERDPFCQVPQGEKAESLRERAWCGPDCNWKSLQTSQEFLPDLKVGFEANVSLAIFRWVYVRGGEGIYNPKFCVNPGDEEERRISTSETCDSTETSKAVHFSRGCFGGTGWRLMMLPNFYVANVGKSEFSCRPQTAGNDENDWVWSKCGQYRQKLKMKLGFVEVQLRLLALSAPSVAAKKELQRRAYLAEGPVKFSRRPFYETRSKIEGSEDWVPSGLSPDKSGIRLSSGGAFFSSDSSSLPCDWTDITEEYDIFASKLTEIPARLCNCGNTVELTISVNWLGKNAEKDDTNNVVRGRMDWHSFVPLRPSTSP